MKRDAAIAVEGLTFGYPKSAFRLRIPRFEVATGERLAVTGASGCGKTTLLNLVAGILTPEQGQVRVGDTEVAKLSDAGRRAFRLTRVGFVFQDFGLLEYLSVLDNVLLPYRISGALRLDEGVVERAVRLLDRVGMASSGKRNITRLSQGERQRVAICRAMLASPDVVLADEATGNLDPENKTKILDLMFEYAAEAGATVMAVTHDHGLLSSFDRAVDFASLNDAGSCG